MTYTPPPTPPNQQEKKMRHPARKTPHLSDEQDALPPLPPHYRGGVSVTPPRSTTVMGQCKQCLDFFSVEILLVRKKLYVQETARLKTQGDGETIIHRPGVCNGKVKLYGSLETLYNTTKRCPTGRATHKNARRTVSSSTPLQ